MALRIWSRRVATPFVGSLLFGIAVAMVDESGKYHAGNDLTHLAPPEPSESDRAASNDLAKQPVEKLFRLLAYELYKEETRPKERVFRLPEFQAVTAAGCLEKLLGLAQETADLAKEVETYHLNITGTSGLYWMLHAHPEEHSWAWLVSSSHDRVVRKVQNHMARLVSLAVDDQSGSRCLSPSFRTALMNAALTWKRLTGDHAALLWNGVAFGILGDVTSWRELDENGTAEEGAGGPPPNVSWSENIIFGNMWLSSCSKWLEQHAQEIGHLAFTELQWAKHETAAGRPYDFSLAGSDHRKSADGVLSSFEFMRRQVFQGWKQDKGLLRALLRYCLQPDYGDTRVSVGDFGAGGGRYGQWLNDTGLIEAFAFDATLSAHDIAGGSVIQADLTKVGIELWRSFDWVLCLEVVAHLPAEKVKALLQTIKRHASKGAVISWAPSGVAETSIVEKDFIALVQSETGFSYDSAASEKLRAGAELPHFASSTLVFRAEAPQASSSWFSR
eukprot:TRINITY_DN1254_c0_g1_i1.p1 TRINITY_DN1254_c0_g1~~TRINITY_DN1254_c0_g1_i1.p1  ORF type:complete len:502 (+),score=83.85 TRINITY_DN1254_c0_g1_i1:54-1559(+)